MKLSFKMKVVALSVFLSAVSAVIGGISYTGLQRVEAAYDLVVDDVGPNLEYVNAMYLEFREVRINLRSLGLTNLSESDGKNYIAGVEKSIAQFDKYASEYKKMELQPGEQALMDEMIKNWQSFKALGIEAVRLYKDGSPASLVRLDKIFKIDCLAEAGRMDKSVSALKAFHQANEKEFVAQAHAAGERTNFLTLLLSVGGIFAGLTIGVLFAAKVTSTITKVARQLGVNADQVNSASFQLATASQSLSQATTEQSASLEETAASLEEINAMISKATDSAKIASTSSLESQHKAEEGRQAVDQMVTSMNEISQSNEEILAQIVESNRQMSEIVNVIQDIGNRTKVINEIVFQTKLLSFNASVEAARAGEHGKGFAVVAEEVGNLAQMSGNAAKEISDMLGVSISKVENIVKNTQQKVEGLIKSGKEKVQTGVHVAERCSEVLHEIVQNVSKVSVLAQEISQAAEEQTQGVREITKAMSQLDTVTQQNAASSEEAAESSKTLSAQSNSLKSSVDELMSVIRGERGEAPMIEEHSNLLPLKRVASAKPKAHAPRAHKSVSGDFAKVPDYNNEGFEDV